MNKLKPALLGGLIVGILSSIPFVNYCCCLWALGGGGLACYFYIKSSPTPVRPGDGAMLGGLAGVIGAVLFFVIYVPLSYFMGAAAVEEQLARSGVEIPVSGIVLFILIGLLGGIFLLVVSVIGGLIAVPIFEKRKNAPPPPPPQDYSSPV
jgi:hypothetical protein